MVLAVVAALTLAAVRLDVPAGVPLSLLWVLVFLVGLRYRVDLTPEALSVGWTLFAAIPIRRSRSLRWSGIVSIGESSEGVGIESGVPGSRPLWIRSRHPHHRQWVVAMIKQFLMSGD